MSIFSEKHHNIAKKSDGRIQLAGNSAEFQPGDGTRYVFHFGAFSGEVERRFFGCGENSLMVTVMHGGANTYRSSCLSPFSHPAYIKEKLEVSEYTSKVVHLFLQFVFKGEDITPLLGHQFEDWRMAAFAEAQG